MKSTFAPIELGKRGLVATTEGLQTVGHNVSNASVQGYSRQRVDMSATYPLYAPGLESRGDARPDRAGRGRVPDRAHQGHAPGGPDCFGAEPPGLLGVPDKYILMMEQVYNEPTEHSVRALMDQFWGAWQDLSLNPTEMASRRSVLENGKALVDGIHERYALPEERA